MDKKNLYDPFFPYDAEYNKGLIYNLIDNGNITYYKSKKIVKELDLPNLCNQACTSIRDKNEIFQIIKKNDTLIYKSKNEYYSVYCPEFMYQKLKKNYKGDIKKLKNRIFCVMLRYETLSGRSHQFAMETKFKDALFKEYKVNLELFASPLNSYYDYYGSLFYDTDKYFGSLGSFYNIDIIEGFVIANPPYEEELLYKMVTKFIDNIKEEKNPISISFGLPKWGSYRKFRAIEKTHNSKYTKFYRCLNREVYWYDTLLKKRIVIPEHCRSVIQNKKGEKTFNLDNFNKLINKYWLK